MSEEKLGFLGREASKLLFDGVDLLLENLEAFDAFAAVVAVIGWGKGEAENVMVVVLVGGVV